MKICLSVIYTLFFVACIYAQTNMPPKISTPAPIEPCNLDLKQSPALRGLRLDMPKAEVRKEYPLMTITPDPVKSSGIALSHQISNPAHQENLDRITILFRNDKIFSILLTYNDLIKWDSAEEFAAKVSENLNLPRAAQRKASGVAYYSINCGQFGVRMRINNDKQPTLLLTRDPEELWLTTQDRKDAFKP